MINSLLNKLVRSRWLDIGERGQNPAISTSHLVNNPINYVPSRMGRLIKRGQILKGFCEEMFVRQKHDRGLLEEQGNLWLRVGRRR